MIQNRCKIIGITGGIATGKTTVKDILVDRGYHVIDSDIIAREVVEVGKAAYHGVLDYFGDDILDEDKSIDRKKLSDIVFNKPDERKKLEGILYPHIFEEILQQMDNKCINNKDIIFIDIPLLFENEELIRDSGICLDEIWLVYCDRNTQLGRLLKRDNISLDKANLMINAQIDIEVKKKNADVIINNTSTKESLIEQIDKSLFSLEREQR